MTGNANDGCRDVTRHAVIDEPQRKMSVLPGGSELTSHWSSHSEQTWMYFSVMCHTEDAWR